MSPVVRNTLAVIAGFAVGSVVTMSLILVSGSMIPPPAGAETTTLEGLRASIHLFEPRHFVFPFLAHALGTLAGAWIAATIAASAKADMPTGGTLRTPTLVLFTALLTTAAGCGQSGETSGADAPPIPSTVDCMDLSQLRERAVDARRRSIEAHGDRARIIAGSRAKFAASLASIAQLKCRTSVAEADAVLGNALEIARGAGATRSEYETALRWIEADLVAADALALLVNQVPPAPPE